MLATWSWGRIARILALTALGLMGLDLALAPLERERAERIPRAQLRNTAGPAIADSCLTMIRSDPARTADAIVFVGSSVTFGSNVGDDESLPAGFARHQPGFAVYNCAQPGGRPDTAIPIAAAMGTIPARALAVEVMVPVYARRPVGASPAWAKEEVSLLEMATPEVRARVEAAGRFPRPAERIEAGLAGFAREHSRLYRLRGSLWIDDLQLPTYLVWTVRRHAAARGILPRRFHGQSTNVGRLPWRQAYAGRQKPSGQQYFRVPEAALHERAVRELALAVRMADTVGVPVILYEVPINLPFQREFQLMTEEQLARLAEVRRLLFAHLEAAGMPVLPAPEMPDDAFLDKAHLTPLGADLLGAHLAEVFATRIPLPDVVR